ncbi:OLC1v1016702C1 [Oldenlandia corymbosa var. corymbosa]|uniref:OLC1v1016702C1 n=1 Tax=Oldenlandia corymbosa var. corymbosa TaxID=529605 RepID=A0AAV1E7P7_OLDCO|nr:OLC1v1016702C1 [Oldenlandia corymbosa var. corymbosa]
MAMLKNILHVPNGMWSIILTWYKGISDDNNVEDSESSIQEEMDIESGLPSVSATPNHRQVRDRRPIISASRSPHQSSPGSNINGIQKATPQGKLDVMAQNFKSSKIRKVMIPVQFALIGIVFNPLAPISSILRTLLIFALPLGFTATMIGLIMPDTLCRAIVEQIGVVSIFFAFYGLQSQFFPGYWKFISGGCFVVSVTGFYFYLSTPWN